MNRGSDRRASLQWWFSTIVLSIGIIVGAAVDGSAAISLAGVAVPLYSVYWYRRRKQD